MKGKINRKSNKKNIITSFIIVLLVTVVILSSAIISSSKIARADASRLDNIGKQIVALGKQDYSPSDIKKIVEITNIDINLYIVYSSDEITFGRINVKDEPEDISTIRLSSKN